MNQRTSRTIDYYNPKSQPTVAEAASPVPRRPVAAVPHPFDTVLTQSDDLAGVTVVITALQAARIPYHRAAKGELDERMATLFVNHDDYARAAAIASEVFARRSRIRAMNPPKSKLDKMLEQIEDDRSSSTHRIW